MNDGPHHESIRLYRTIHGVCYAHAWFLACPRYISSMSGHKRSWMREAGRLIDVAAQTGGFALRLGMDRLQGKPIDDAAQAERLFTALASLKGPAMKVGQILSIIPGILPPSYSEALSKLHDRAPGMDDTGVRMRMRAELGLDWPRLFTTFEPKPRAAASLGQVHRATLPDGRAVAVKLQYPNMTTAVEADLRQLRFILNLYVGAGGPIRTEAVLEELSERLREELDYRLEARNMLLYGGMREELGDAVHTPSPLSALSTSRLLTMDWLDGTPLSAFYGAPQMVRNRIAALLFTTWYRPFFRCGVLHGDPHPGNYSINPSMHLNLFDFGCIRLFDAAFVSGVALLWQSLERKDSAAAAEAYRLWGFERLDKALVETLNLWAAFLFEPFLRRGAGRLFTPERTAQGKALAITLHTRLRALGGVTPPRGFVLMDRAALGLGGVLERLQAHIDWRALWEESMDGFAHQALTARQATLRATAAL
jgi:predicted unusual protein kinase regulating ubiquinone biosynthesis (AarF/ABC1/UbiB family)